MRKRPPAWNSPVLPQRRRREVAAHAGIRQHVASRKPLYKSVQSSPFLGRGTWAI